MEFGVLCVTRFDFTKDIAKQFTSHLLFINILSKTYHSFMYSHWVFFPYQYDNVCLYFKYRH